MALSQRERTIAIGTGAVVAAFLVYFVVISPFADALTKVKSDKAALIKEKSKDVILLRDRDRTVALFKEMTDGGLLSNSDEAGYQAQTALREWARQSNVSIDSSKPERTTQEKGFAQINIHVTATGSMANISSLLWCVESAKIPVRISEMQIRPRKSDSSDDLQLELSVSTLSIVPDTKKGAGESPSASASAFDAKGSRS